MAVFFLFSNISNAAEKFHNKRYPPYPEVWGYNLYVPDAEVGAVYRVEDGDILFVLYTYNDRRNPKTGFVEPFKEKCTLLKFFSEEKIELDPSECEKKIAHKELGQKVELPIQPNVPIRFSDGSSLQYVIEPEDKRCAHLELTQKFLLKTSKTGEQKKYSLFSLFPNDDVSMTFDKGECPNSGNASPILYQKLSFIGANLIPLEDDTFIAYGPRIIVRFNKEMNTKFVPKFPVEFNGYSTKQNQHFFVRGFEEIKAMGEKISPKLPYYQTLHDNLLDDLIVKYE